MDPLEPVIEQHELVGQLPLRRTRPAIEVPHAGTAAGPFGHPLAHRDAVGAGAVLPLHVIEAVDRIVGQVERRDVLLQQEGRVGQVGGEPRIRFPIAPARRRKGRVGRTTLVGLAPAVTPEPVGAGIGAKEMVEAPILEEEHDDVIDRRASALGSLRDTRPSGGARGQREREKRRADESWTTIAHAVF